jgi:hypothetical protein
MPEGDYETRFGKSWRPGEPEGQRSTDQQVELEVAGLDEPVALGGRIDRLAWSANGTHFRVIDYKTGGSRQAPGDGELKGGDALQLPIYLLAGKLILDADLAEGATGSAEYHYATRRGEFNRSSFTTADLADRAADFDTVISTIVGGIRDGAFQMESEDEWACKWCDFDGLCPTSRFRQMERKAEDPASKRHQAMRAIA